MQYRHALTTWLTAATVAIIALSNVALVVIVQTAHFGWVPPGPTFWPMSLATGTATILVMSVLDSTLNELYGKLTASEARAQEDSRRDTLTGLGNRKFLLEAIERRIGKGSTTAVSALLLIDLDQFKRVNDTLGHAAGDDLIMQVGQRLGAAAQDAMVSRLGGDEFALIVDATSIGLMNERCDAIYGAIAGTYKLGTNDVVIGASVGWALFEPGLDASEMMRRADIAMYRAKTAGIGHKQFCQQMISEIEKRTLIENRLRQALEAGTALSARFQPQVDRNGQVVALETLLRWHDELLGDVSPIEAIRVAEEAKLINDLGFFIVEQACVAAVALPSLKLSFNVSMIQLQDERFPGYLAMLTQRYDIEPRRINLEIPEAAIVKMGEGSFATMQSLAATGFNLVVDNYGSSSSNLTYLTRAAVSAIKLDRSMIKKTQEDGSVAVMRAKVALAKALELDVICCGVANSRDQAVAVSAGCDLFQGFHHSLPLPLERVVARIAAGKMRLAETGVSADHTASGHVIPISWPKAMPRRRARAGAG
jgi:diguanylate cyclase (GGDEF)-like protein